MGGPQCYRAVYLWLTNDVEREERCWPAQVAMGDLLSNVNTDDDDEHLNAMEKNLSIRTLP